MSYARQHLLYKALKDLERLYKTDFILRYIAGPELRATIEGMMTKVERSNKFSSAVTLGNNGTGHPASTGMANRAGTEHSQRLQDGHYERYQLLQSALLVGKASAVFK